MLFKLRAQIFTLVSLLALLTLPTNTIAKPSSKYLSSCPTTKSFDFPVGVPDAKNYYNAQKFGKNFHLGDDWNGKGGGNTDLGDPVYAASDGIVSFSENIKGGWGNVIRIYHNYGTKQKPVYIESLYAHLNKRLVKVGSLVKKGEKIGTIGNAGGIYWAHLHFEIRDKLDMPIGQGYSKDTSGYIDPTKFIRSHRKIKKNPLK
ncbi:MAG: M23 family metallopeptidase [Cocleimonas sp.]|nr:M23 family metallopeptidase [Cocleimonas sp.]